MSKNKDIWTVKEVIAFSLFLVIALLSLAVFVTWVASWDETILNDRCPKLEKGPYINRNSCEYAGPEIYICNLRGDED